MPYIIKQRMFNGSTCKHEFSKKGLIEWICRTYGRRHCEVRREVNRAYHRPRWAVRILG